MRRLISGFGIFLLIFCCRNSITRAAVVGVSWTGTVGNNTIDVDDQGGSFNNNNDNCAASGPADNTYHFEIAGGIQISSTLTMYLFNGSAVDDGADIDDDAKGGAPNCTGSTGEDFSGTSGFSLFNPFSGLPPLTQLVAL